MAAVAAAARLACLLWAGSRFPPTADGTFYHRIAERIAAGLGSTWLWPDGTVTFAAHYPVGYPALIALAYAAIRPSAVLAGCLNGCLGAASAVAAHRIAARASGRAGSLAAGLAVALHPGLVFYTPAVMTEGVTAAILVSAAWMACRAREATRARGRFWLVTLGATMGLATLVRPQSLLLAPLLGFLAAGAGSWFGARGRCRSALLVTAIALLVCAPWTARNCLRMGRCALVSVNGGWNLLIGAGEGATGAWAPIEVPPSCREVWGEADKDDCFRRQAQRAIEVAPLRWISLVPAKLAATFDYCGAAGFYLHQANAEAFDERRKLALGIVETLYERLGYLGALVLAAVARGPMRKGRIFLAVLGSIFLFREHAYIGVVLLSVTIALLGSALFSAPVLLGATAAALAATALTHAAFFGAGRYGMVAFPLVTTAAAVGFAQIVPALTISRRPGDTMGAGERGARREGEQENHDAPDRN